MSGGHVPDGDKVLAWLLGAFVAALVVLVLISYATASGLQFLTNGSLSVGVGLVFLCYLSFLSATIAYRFSREQSPRYRLLLNWGILSASICGLGLLCGAELSVIGLSLAVVLLVQFGAYAFAQLRLRNVARLMRSKRWSDGDAGAISAFERQFVQHSYVYFALPVGGVLGVGYGFARQLPAAELGRGTFGLITALIAAGVLTFLVLDSLHLTRILVEPSKVRRVMAKFRAPGLIVVEVPSAAITQPKGAEMLLDGAIMAADVRTLLLYNQHQMLGVLIMLLLIFSMALGYRPKPATLIGVVITVSIITAQLPYVVGQMRARAVVLGSSLGLQRQELKDSLDKHCPLFPSLPFWAAITAVSGSAGAFGAQLVEEALKGLVFPK